MKRELQQKTNGDKKQIPTWKKWIVILLIIQAFVNIQSYRAHRLMWDSIHDTNTHLNQTLQIQREYHEKVNLILGQVLEFLKVD